MLNKDKNKERDQIKEPSCLNLLGKKPKGKEEMEMNPSHIQKVAQWAKLWGKKLISLETKEKSQQKSELRATLTFGRKEARNQEGDELMFYKALITPLESPLKRTYEYLW